MHAADFPARFAARLLALTLALGSARAAVAQRGADPDPRRSFTAWAGASFDSPGGGVLGGLPDRDLFLAGVRAEWMLTKGRQLALAATFDAIPLAIVGRNPRYTDRVVGRLITGGERIERFEQTGRGPVYGFGASPLGLELYGPRIRSVRPYLTAAAGLLWFTRNTPEPEARRLNATAEAGAGLRIACGRHQALLLGWKFLHISNGGTAPYNPGLDGNVIYFGFQRH